MTLAFLGLVDVNIPTLGTMINWVIIYQAMFLGRWYWVLTPVCLAVFMFIALYWLSVSISEYLDPRTRIQRVGV
jgi:peptide/nickel transport system permease protein